jgi:ASC-1-like (ASCH) protein
MENGDSGNREVAKSEKKKLHALPLEEIKEMENEEDVIRLIRDRHDIEGDIYFGYANESKYGPVFARLVLMRLECIEWVQIEAWLEDYFKDEKKTKIRNLAQVLFARHVTAEVNLKIEENYKNVDLVLTRLFSNNSKLENVVQKIIYFWQYWHELEYGVKPKFISYSQIFKKVPSSKSDVNANRFLKMCEFYLYKKLSPYRTTHEQTEAEKLEENSLDVTANRYFTEAVTRYKPNKRSRLNLKK